MLKIVLTNVKVGTFSWLFQIICVYLHRENNKKTTKTPTTMAQTQGVVISELENPQKSVVITYMRKVLLSYIDLTLDFDEKRAEAYKSWVAKLRRGLDSFFPRTKSGKLIPIEGKTFRIVIDGQGYIAPAFRIIEREEAMKRFDEYLSKCKANGIDPLAKVKAGRKPKSKGVG